MQPIEAGCEAPSHKEFHQATPTGQVQHCPLPQEEDGQSEGLLGRSHRSLRLTVGGGVEWCGSRVLNQVALQVGLELTGCEVCSVAHHDCVGYTMGHEDLIEGSDGHPRRSRGNWDHFQAFGVRVHQDEKGLALEGASKGLLSCHSVIVLVLQ